MTNKLVVIINSLQVPKIKKILLYEMKFLVPNYSCLQSPWQGGYRPQIPVLSVLCPQLNLLKPSPPPNKIPGYATAKDSCTTWRWLLSRAETCSCTLGSNVNTPLPSNKISCVRQEHTLQSNWSLTLREEHRLKLFENRVLRGLFGPRRHEVTG